uniref:Uncharacterized protein n=1 Tax=Arundo donax TaxID=35708 RepID=A0A0A9FZU7_ARUDO
MDDDLYRMSSRWRG